MGKKLYTIYADNLQPFSVYTFDINQAIILAYSKLYNEGYYPKIEKVETHNEMLDESFIYTNIDIHINFSVEMAED